PVAQDGIVYFSNTRGFVYALDAETGEYLARKKLEGKLAPAGPIIVNDTLFVGSQDSNVYAIPLSDFEMKKDSVEGGNKGVMGYSIGAAIIVILIITLLFVIRKRR